MLDRMAKAARPSLFDGACDPELLVSLVLSDLMTPSLWAFRDKIEERLEAEAGNVSIMAEIQRYVNHHLSHLNPKEVARVSGIVEVDELRERNGGEIEYVMGLLRRHFEDYVERGTFQDNMSNVWGLMDEGRFPNYEYATFDLVRAHRRDLPRREHRSIGITSCGDEAVLVYAVIGSLPGCSLDDVTIFGSPGHYTTLARHDGELYWFNGKREFFDQPSWRALVAGLDEHDAQEAFLDRLADMDRILTARGVYRFESGDCTLSPARLEAILAQLDRFFGMRLVTIAEALERPVRYLENPVAEAPLDDLTHARDAAECQQVVRGLAARYPGSLYEAALYAYRGLDVPDRDAYARASRAGWRTRKAAEGLSTLEEAVALVEGVAGKQSVFPEPDRIALADEVLHFGTGDRRERALLLDSLVRLGLDAPAGDVELLLEAGALRVGGRRVELA